MTERSRTRKFLIGASVSVAATAALLGFGGAAYALSTDAEPAPEYVELVDAPEDPGPADSPGNTEEDCDYEGAEAQTADRT